MSILEKSRLLGLTISMILAISTPMYPYANMNEHLLVYLPFDEGEGDIAFDATGNHFDGMLSCFTTECTLPEWYESGFGTGLKLDGKDDFVEIFNVTGMLSNLSSFSVILLIRALATPTGGFAPIIAHKANQNPDTSGWALVYNGWNRKLEVQISDGIVQETLGRHIEPWQDQWYQVALTVSKGKSATLYLDATELDSIDITNMKHFDSKWNLTIGAYKWTGFFCDCLIDEVRIYDTAVSPDELIMLLGREVNAQ